MGTQADFNVGPTSPGPYARLAVQYSLMAAYGLVAYVLGVTTVAAVSGDVWATVWPLLVTASAAAALISLNRSRKTGKYGWEMVCTLFLVAHMCSYSVYIVARTIEDGDISRLTVALLPIIACVIPFARVIDLGRKKK
jgi:hypothetical protein